MKRQGVVIQGARRVWRTHDSTTTWAVRKAIADFTSISMDQLKIKRKYKTAEGNLSSAAPTTTRVIRWWFVVRADESILQKLDNEWHKVALQTGWELAPLLQYVPSQGQSNPTPQQEGSPGSTCPEEAASNEPAEQLENDHSITQTSDSPQQQTLLQPGLPASETEPSTSQDPELSNQIWLTLSMR